MKSEKIVLALLLACLSGTIHAQENRLNLKFQKSYIPLKDRKDTTITHTFSAPELQVSRAFIDSLNAILFDKKHSAARYQSDRDFYLAFTQRDSLNYSLQVMLGKYPSIGSSGFFEQNGYFYWFGDVPPGIILGSGPERQFTYDEYIPGGLPDIYDPPFWWVVYNRQTGSMEDTGWPFD